jgi:hypothetical protein
MWPRLIGLAIVEAGLVWWLTRPIQTRAILLDPTNAAPGAPLEPVLLQFIGYVAIVGVILIPFLAYRVISRSSYSEDNPLD